MRRFAHQLIIALLLASGCEKAAEKSADTGIAVDVSGTDSAIDVSGSDTEDPSANDPEFHPSLLRLSKDIAPVRDLVARQGHMHAHTVFSHDACDGQPRVNGETGARNEECFWDFRDGICQSGLDFIFITDHPSGMFCEYDYPEELLYEPGEGDTLVQRNGGPVANLLQCKDGRKVLLIPGFDNHSICLGLEKHLRPTSAERKQLYQSKTNEAFDELRKDGHALMVAGYASDWERDKINALHWDGYEVYNPSTNMKKRLGDLLAGVTEMISDPDNAPHPELMLIAIFEEGVENMLYWSDLAQKQRIFNYIGPNAHRNSLSAEMSDGDRGDSYRRLFRWFGNFVLLPKDKATGADDRLYKEALAAGRIYNAFLFFGYPVGFDFYATSGGQTIEMGTEFPTATGVTLHVRVPRVYGKLPAGSEAPVINAKLLKAVKDGWQTVAEGSKDFTFAVQEAGSYRVDVRIVPKHLKKFLGAQPDKYMTERSWVYSGMIYLGTAFGGKAP